MKTKASTNRHELEAPHEPLRRFMAAARQTGDHDASHVQAVDGVHVFVAERPNAAAWSSLVQGLQSRHRHARCGR
jgi:hypothetical protein